MDSPPVLNYSKHISGSVKRRFFLESTAAAGITGLAGCSSLNVFDDDGAGGGPADVVREYYDRAISFQQAAGELFHSETAYSDFRVRDTRVVERDLSTDRFAEAVSLDDETATRIARGESTALVEVELSVLENGEETEQERMWAVATEHGQWRIAETASIPDDVDDDVPDEVAEHMEDANNWEGSMADNTDRDTVSVTITVDPDFAYDPAGMFISEGTEVTWEWDHDGDSHTVTHDNGDEFDSGIISGEGETFTHTFEDTGTYLIICTPHQGIGMLGAVVVE